MPNELRDADFEVVSGKPAVVKVRGSDGKLYTIRMAVTVLKIVEEIGAPGPEGNPLFHVTSNFALSTEPSPEGGGR